MIRKPKRRNAPKTKARILAAAQKSFSEVGYSQAGIRDIAAIAGVDAALLLRYFGSKAGLFEAALSGSMQLEALLQKGRNEFGENVVNLILGTDRNIKPTSIMTLATGHADAREITTRVLRKHVLAPLAKWLGPPRADARALEIIVLSSGISLFMQIRLLPARKDIVRDLGTWLAHSIQAIVDQ